MELKEIKSAINSFCEDNNLHLRISGNLLDRHNNKMGRECQVVCKIKLHNYPYWNHVTYNHKDKLIKFVRELANNNKDCKYLRDLNMHFVGINLKCKIIR